MVLIAANNLSLKPGESFTLKTRVLHVLMPTGISTNLSNLEYHILKMPSVAGKLINRRQNNKTITLSFSHADLISGNVILTLDSVSTKIKVLNFQDDFALEWILRACVFSIHQSKCSLPTILRVQIDVNNYIGLIF